MIQIGITFIYIVPKKVNDEVLTNCIIQQYGKEAFHSQKKYFHI